ncbi:hypothetical protein GCM10025780_31120 [Frondihabitans cladoniiphilus]|uniref:Uncharacterized protein n=1 Tax=Frondihabitans cladoniiphilus TaxID=715785 RepID=A0ABP8WAG2_9MICO
MTSVRGARAAREDSSGELAAGFVLEIYSQASPQRETVLEQSTVVTRRETASTETRTDPVTHFSLETDDYLEQGRALSSGAQGDERPRRCEVNGAGFCDERLSR